MQQQTIRLLDIYLGRLLCAVLTITRRLLDGWRGSRADEEPRKILFLKLIEQGATVLAHDAMQAAAERVGRENLYFLVFEENRFILDVLDSIPTRNILTVRSQRLTWFVRDVWHALARLRRERVDAVVDMEFFSRASAMLAFLSGAQRRAGMHRFSGEGPYRGDLFTHRLQHNPYLHVSQTYRLLVESLWADPDDVPLLKTRPRPLSALPSFRAEAQEQDRVRKLLADTGLNLDGALLLLNPSPLDRLPLRRWPNGNFTELARRVLAVREDVEVVLTGTPEESQILAAMAHDLGPRAISLAGLTSLRDILVVYALADVLVTSDGGPGHFSALTDIQSIVLFGPETPKVFGPIGKHSQALHSGFACSPCVNVYNHRFSSCHYNACMMAISIDEVLVRVLTALEARVPRRLRQVSTV